MFDRGKIQLIVFAAEVIIFTKYTSAFRLTIYKVTKKYDTISLDRACHA
jgi:hypothetical protein